MPNDAQKADPDIKRELQLAAYKHDLSKAVRVEDLAKYYLDAGADPAYIAYRFSLALERCQKYAAALAEQREQRKLRGASETG